MEIPRLTTVKVIKIAKFLAIDGMKIYDNYRNVIESPELSDSEKVSLVVSELKEEQIIHLLSILLGISDEEALSIDPFDNLEIITTFVEKTDVERAFTNVQTLIKKFKRTQTKDDQNENSARNVLSS